MYTTEEMAEILGISYQTAYRLIKAGKIKAVRIGGAFRIEKEEVERIKKEGTG